MTLVSTGDKGQRYEVTSTGYPVQGETCVIGWTDSLPTAERMAAAARLAPSCTASAVRDRWSPDPINLQGSGPAPIAPREG